MFQMFAESTAELVDVSIQLISPASGDNSGLNKVHILKLVSIQLISPASGDYLT